MAKYNDVECFMYYMCNKWGLDEAKSLFGDNLGEHIYNKWLGYSDSLTWYGSIDKECRGKIYNRALEIYGRE